MVKFEVCRFSVNRLVTCKSNKEGTPKWPVWMSVNGRQTFPGLFAQCNLPISGLWNCSVSQSSASRQIDILAGELTRITSQVEKILLICLCSCNAVVNAALLDGHFALSSLWPIVNLLSSRKLHFQTNSLRIMLHQVPMITSWPLGRLGLTKT